MIKNEISIFVVKANKTAVFSAYHMKKAIEEHMKARGEKDYEVIVAEMFDLKNVEDKKF